MSLLNITWKRLLDGFIKEARFSSFGSVVDPGPNLDFGVTYNIYATTATTMFYNNTWAGYTGTVVI